MQEDLERVEKLRQELVEALVASGWQPPARVEVQARQRADVKLPLAVLERLEHVPGG